MQSLPKGTCCLCPATSALVERTLLSAAFDVELSSKARALFRSSAYGEVNKKLGLLKKSTAM